MSTVIDSTRIQARLDELQQTAQTLTEYREQLVEQQKEIEEHLFSVHGAIQALEALLTPPTEGS